LDDEQLDSGDDEGRYDRREDRMDEGPDGETESLTIAEMTIARAPVPATNDPEVCDNITLNVTSLC
jgi:RNA polymerase-associated protein LEO1